MDIVVDVHVGGFPRQHIIFQIAIPDEEWAKQITPKHREDYLLYAVSKEVMENIEWDIWDFDSLVKVGVKPSEATPT